MRPLSIYSYEDKLVQEALRRPLEAVFESANPGDQAPLTQRLAKQENNFQGEKC